MSEQVGVVFADYRADASSSGLNMRRVEVDDVPVAPRSLVADADGSLFMNGGKLPARQQYMFAMSAPDANRASSISMAALIDSEVQRILQRGCEMARTLLSEHNDQLNKLAAELMVKEQLDRKQFEALLS
jgi:ATP-dependent Zn protease